MEMQTTPLSRSVGAKWQNRERRWCSRWAWWAAVVFEHGEEMDHQTDTLCWALARSFALETQVHYRKGITRAQT